MEKIESEKKFLVKFPTSWVVFSEMLDNLIDIKRITQVYLKPKEDEPSPRIRKTIEGLSGETSVKFDYNQKEFVESGVHKEKEHEITKDQYQKYLKFALPNKSEVNKIRFVFKYNEQTFELDVFKGPLKGLAIMEIELDDINDTVELPPYLKVIKEVTKDKKYNNYELASRKLNESKY